MAPPSRFALAALTAGALVGALQVTAFGPRFQGFGPFPFEACGGRREIALTFDDGPNEPHTSGPARHSRRP